MVAFFIVALSCGSRVLTLVRSRIFNKCSLHKIYANYKVKLQPITQVICKGECPPPLGVEYIKKALKSANIDQTNPAAINKFFTNNSTALQKIKMEHSRMVGLKQIMIEAVSGKISGSIAKKLSNDDAIAEKILDKSLEKAKDILTKY